MLVGLIALIVATYCFWLMTVPLSYDLVYIVVGGFVVSVGVFFAALISSVIIAIRLRRSRHAQPGSEISPGV
jgi:Na+-driven multidrug efflux pump